jgi:transposase-like protein
MGLAESAAEFFPEAAWQRCIVHWYRNVFSHVPSTKVLGLPNVAAHFVIASNGLAD